MDMSDIWKLARLLRQNGDRVLHDGSKLALTASLLQKLNDAFLIIVDREDTSSAFQVVSTNSEQDELFNNLHFLHDFVQKVLALKIEQNWCSLTRNSTLNISKFKNAKYLELRKVPVRNVSGLQGLRSQLQAVVCVQSLHRLEELLSRCGADQSSDFVWSELREAVFSYNSISQLDSSLLLAPWLQVLDLSHNNLSTAAGLENLLCLTYLNLAYNCLTAVPAFSKQLCAKLQILILKNNFIESIDGLSSLENLLELDVSCNFLTKHDLLQPLGRLPALSTLSLSDNPVCFCQEYRAIVAGLLHPNAAFNQFALDGIALTKLEKLKVGTAAKFEDVIMPVHPPEKPDGGEQVCVASSSAKPQRSKKSSRVREAVISEQLGVEQKLAAPAASPSTSLDLSCEHLETKKQVEMLREKFGEDDWLHHRGGSCLQDVLGMEKTAPPDLGETLRQCLSDDGSGSQETTMNSPAQGNTTVIVHDRLQVGNSIEDISESPAVEKVVDGSHDKEAVLETDAEEEIEEMPLQESPEEEEPVEEVDDDVADIKLYLVQKYRPGVDILDEMFLVITDSYVKERNMVSGKTKEKWAVETLLSCTKTLNDPVTIQLTFDTVRRDRQERVYIMDEEDAEQLMRFLGAILDSRSLAAMNQVVFRCLKCQSQFTQEFGSQATVQTGCQNVTCPTCASPVVIIMDEVPLPSNSSAACDQPATVAGDVESGASAMTKCPSQSSIGPRSRATDTLEVMAIVHNTSSPVECSQPTATCRSATSLNQSPERFQDTGAVMRRCESDIEIISNPSQSSIEVLDDSGKARGSTPSRKTCLEENKAVAVMGQQSSVTGMIMMESSSSGSLADSICTAYENPPKVTPSDKKLPAAEGASGSLVPTVPGSVDPVRATSVSESSDTTLEIIETKADAAVSVPEVGVSYSSVLEDLLQSVTSRMRPAAGVRMEKPSSGNSIQYSYEDFSSVDHRVKLHLYVHVFGDQEQLVFLLKARILRHPSDASFIGCLVFSSSKIYVLQITGSESDEPEDWLKLEDSWSASHLKTMWVLPSEQGVSLELKSSGSSAPVCCLAILQYSTYTTQFLEFLSGLSLPDSYNFSTCGISDRHILLIQQLTLSMPADEDVDLALHHLVIFSHCCIRKGTEEVRALRIGVFVLTGTALLVTDEDVDWLFPGSSACPEPVCAQSMSNLVELETERLSVTLHFLEESTQREESWVIAVDSREMVEALTDSVKSLWEDLFSVPLQVLHNY